MMNNRKLRYMGLVLGLCVGLMMAACGGDDNNGQNNPSQDNSGQDAAKPSSDDSGAAAQESPAQKDPDKPRPGKEDGEHGFTDLTWPTHEYYYCGDREIQGFEGNLDKYCAANYGEKSRGFCYKENDEETKACYKICAVKGEYRDECEFRHTQNLGDVYMHSVYQCIVVDNHLIEDIADLRKCVHECDASGKACD